MTNALMLFQAIKYSNKLQYYLCVAGSISNTTESTVCDPDRIQYSVSAITKRECDPCQ